MDHISSDDTALDLLQESIGYRFTKTAFLREALTHKSYANEMRLENAFGNERLEFLGDAVLDFVLSHLLMDRFRHCSEGQLSKMRAAIVNQKQLAAVSRQYGIGPCILLSHGEHESRGRDKDSILANVYEALIAAVYYDGGITEAFRLIQRHFSRHIEEASKGGFFKDYKSRLQEYAQVSFSAVPEYTVITEEGPDHIKQFESRVSIAGVEYETGRGKNKKSAEQDAAEKTLKKLLKE